jgi:hypothetical protein
MSASHSSHRGTTTPRHTRANQGVDNTARLEVLAQLLEDAIPSLKSKDERRFYREVVRSYRAAAQREVRTRRSS